MGTENPSSRCLTNRLVPSPNREGIFILTESGLTHAQPALDHARLRAWRVQGARFCNV